MKKRILVRKEKFAAEKGISIRTLEKLMKLGKVAYVKYPNKRVLLPL